MSALVRLGSAPVVEASLLPPRPTTRFAPSVTGPLHLGHVANAAWTWALARALGGRVLLRLEDHDRSRFRPEHERAILEELEWLGFVPDEPELSAFRAGPCAFRQSDHPERYLEALARLRESTRLYGCECTRKAIAERVGPDAPYDGRCRGRVLDEHGDCGLRAELPDEALVFVDAMAGRQEQRPSRQCGDLLLRDRDGGFTYQLCVVADDLAEGVDLVIRGRDLLESTGRQLLLARLLGRAEAPAFAHHPLVGESDGRKLSKTDGDACVAAWRAAGRAPGELIGRAAFLSGLCPSDAPLEAEELAAAGAAALSRA